MSNFNESEHPRANDGKFTNKDTPAEEQRYNELYGEKELKNKKIEHLVDVLKKGKDKNVGQLLDVLNRVKKVRLKEIHNYIRTLNPVKLKMNNDEIIAEFDKFTADKNVYTIGNSDVDGYRYKLTNTKEIPKHIEQSNYDYSKSEVGKTAKQHKGVKEWHYFKKTIKTNDGNFNMVVNVRDKGNNRYIYEIALKKEKT